MRKLFLFVSLLWLSYSGFAQVSKSLSDNIRSVRVIAAGDWTRTPVVSKNDGETVEISFDEMSHDTHRYAYRIEHCNSDWTVSDGLFESDYLSGTTSGIYIDNYKQSLNTTQLYTHYSFTLPNADVGLKLSGNYRVSILDPDADSEQPLAYAYFSVTEQSATLSISASTDTEVDKNNSRQQLTLGVNFLNMGVQDPRRQFSVTVLQNERWDNAIVNPPVTSVSPSSLLWEHSRDLIFRAANEFRKMEMLNVHVPMMGVDKIRFHEPYYHFTLYPDKPRTHYVYDEDKDGLRYIRSDYAGADYDNETEYVLTHFFLQMPQREDGDFYVCGRWTNGIFDEDCRMQYNTSTGCYEATPLLKLGYYNYQYLFVPTGQKQGYTQPAEGDFYQTENQYSVYVYYREIGGRYDQLVAYRTFTFKP